MASCLGKLLAKCLGKNKEPAALGSGSGSGNGIGSGSGAPGGASAGICYFLWIDSSELFYHLRLILN